MSQRETFYFKITVLGSGSCVPSHKRYPSSYFFYSSKLKENWLIDIGEGALFRLSEAGESYRDIDRIFISHTHPDHIGALIPLILALKYTPGFKRDKPLFIYGPESVREYLDMHLDFAPYLKCDFPIQFISCSGDTEIEIGEYLIETMEMRHFEPTLGYKWSFNGNIIVYGADGEVSEGLINLAKNADFLILESSYPKEKGGSGHLTTFEAGKVAREAGVKKLLISHFYPEVAGMSKESIEDEIRSSDYQGEIIIAKDLMSLKI